MESNTFTSFFGATPNVFFGNVGRCLEIYFPNKPEAFSLNDLLEPEVKTKADVLKLSKYKKSSALNQKLFETRKQKLVFIYNHQLQLVEKNIISSSQVEEIINKFLKEMKELQMEYLHQRNVIYRNFMIETQGFYNENDDLFVNSLDFDKSVFDI